MHHAVPYLYTYFWLGLSITILLYLVEHSAGKRKKYTPFHNANYFLIKWAVWPIPLLTFFLKKSK